MSPIDYALKEIKYKIPKQILEAAFLQSRGFGDINNKMPISIDYRIREEVIEPRVMVDTNLVGGEDTHIPLSDIPPEHLPMSKTVWRVPLKLTGNRLISKVDSLVYSAGSNTPFSMTHIERSGGYTDAAKALLDSHIPIPNISNTEIRLIGENIVMADALFPFNRSLYLKCTLENDYEFNNLPKTAYPRFSKLVELAVKSFIYNSLIIDLDSAKLSGGVELGTFLSIIEGYADSEEMYEDYLTTTWSKVAILADPESKRRHLKMLVSRR